MIVKNLPPSTFYKAGNILEDDQFRAKGKNEFGKYANKVVTGVVDPVFPS